MFEFFRLMRDHAPLAPVAHAVALFGLGQDDGGLARMVGGGVVGGIDFHRVVAAAAQAVDVGVGHVGGECLQLRVFVEKMFAVEVAVGGGIGLELTVDGFIEAPEQDVVVVAREQRIPVRAPQQLDDVPTGAGKQALQLLHDGAVAAHRAVEALQVAVDDKNQVVEAVARGEGQSGDGFGLIHLAVADKGPDLATGGVGKAAVGEVFHVARLVHRLYRPQAHGAGGELPEVGHQPRVWIGGQALAAGFAAVMVKAVL